MVVRMDWLVKAGVDVLEGMFVFGAAGTLLVLLLSAVEDLRTIADRTPKD